MKLFKVKIKLKQEIAENTLMIELEKPVDFDFKAGQFVMMIIPQLNKDVKGGNERAMSIASSPCYHNLQIVFRKGETEFKKAADKLIAGDEIEIRGPCGIFNLSEIIKQDQIVFLTGGVGITPIRSMLLEALDRKLKTEFFLFYSNIKPETSVFLKEFENINNTDFKFIPTMTRMQGSLKKWKGEQGRIDIEMLKKYIPDISKPVYFIVGSDDFVKSMTNMLKENNIKEEKIKFEKF